MNVSDTALILVLALAIDAVVGDPAWVYRRIPHPVVVMGSMIGWADRTLNKDWYRAAIRRRLGVAAVVAILALAWILGAAIHAVLNLLPFAEILEAVIASALLAQNSLYRHVAAVERGFVGARLAPAQAAVRRIVGRDPASLDAPGTCRAAIESLAENFSDGVVAPAFWFLLFGLPGLFAYKALNTADSMIGHRTRKHLDFGWAAARLDDLANLIPARLSALLLTLAAGLESGASAKSATIAALRDAGHHRSVNAGWPEAAMAGALDLKLAGPRYYGSQLVDDAWMGCGRENATPDDIRGALGLYVKACVVLFAGICLAVVAQI